MGNSIKIRLIVSSLVLFLVALGINVFLNSSSVDKLYEESKISHYRGIGEDLLRILSTQLNSGIGIEEISGIEHIMDKTLIGLQNGEADRKEDTKLLKLASQGGFSVSLVAPDHIISNSTAENLTKTKLPVEVIANYKFTKSKSEEAVDFHHIKHSGLYYLLLPLHDADDRLLGNIALTIPADRIASQKNLLIKNNIVALASIFVGGIVFLVLSLSGIAMPQTGGRSFSKTKISLLIFFVICSAQIAFSGLTTVAFQDLYLKMNKEKARMKIGLFKKEIESYLSKGNSIANLEDGEVLLSELISKSPELSDATLFDRKWHPLFIVTENEAINCQKATYVQLKRIKKSLPKWDPKFNVRLNVSHDDGIKGYISANISKSVLYQRLVDISLDSITVLVISILFLVEMMILIFKVVEKESIKVNSQPVSAGIEDSGINYGLMRPAAFLLLFGYDISMSFLPLHTEKLYAPMFGLSKDMIMGLPISAELLFVGFSILIAGVWLDRRGWHEPFIVGLFLAATGILYSWGAPDVFHFIISRSIAGTGYGLALMASQGFVIEYSSNKSKALGLANLFAGIYAGSICGGATGAMMADRFDYNTVFFTGSVILFSVIIYTFLFMRKGMKKPKLHVESEATPSYSMQKVSRFLSNRIVIALVFFSSLPAAIAVVGFLNYFSPIYLNRIGASQSTIGRVLMIYGICLIYIGPLVGKYVDASNKKRLYIFLGCVLGSMAFLTFTVVEGLIAAAISVLLLGLSSSFVLASQSAYTLKLKVTQELGPGKSIGIFRSTSRGGQVLGPIIFSWLILATDIRDGITYFGIAYFGLALIFLLLTMRDKKLLSFNY